MFRALTHIIKIAICIFITLIITKWMFGFFGINIEIDKIGTTDTLSLILMGTSSAVLAFTVGIFSGYAWGNSNKKPNTNTSQKQRPSVCRFCGYY